jgi:histidinol-phosphate/aromatic aminotransferase/cobyric acid decarboxylase-like protein
LLERYRLVICDEAFLPLVPGGESQSLIPWLGRYPNLIVIRSLTKLYGVAGLRLGYALASEERLRRWASWRDPWPVNGLAASLGEGALADPHRYGRWCGRVQAWVAAEGAWLGKELARLPGLVPMPSAANYLLLRSSQSLQPLREALEQRHRILLRDCRSFPELGEHWLRLGYLSRRNNRRLVAALAEEGERLGLS